MLRFDCWTVYTSSPTAGAMRGYGIPQAAWFAECLTDDMATAIGMDPYEFRMKNCMEDGFVDPANGITFHTYGLTECIKKGREYIHWDEKREAYKNQTGPVRRGVGMAMFIYKTGVYPISLETASARITLNQDGSIQLSMGATEIGQGADTVFSQMVAETLHTDMEHVHIKTVQDTDVSPFDTGAYASRQSFVTGTAVRHCAEILRDKILAYAKTLLPEIDTRELTLKDNWIWVGDEQAISLAALAEESYYSLTNSSVLTAEVSEQVKKKYDCNRMLFCRS